MAALKGKALVAQLIKEKALVVISKTYCPFCVKAKNALGNYKVNPEASVTLELENLSSSEMNEIQDYMKQVTGGRTVPRVFIGGKCIGGGDETMALHRQKKLGPLLQEAGALLD